MSVSTPTMPAGYVHLEHLGEGGQGTVSKVQRVSDGKILAMKTVRLSRKSRKYKVDALKEEFAIHQSIQNRYVVNVESSFTDEENQLFYIFMELCEGQDLDAFIYRHKKKRQTLSETQIWRILTQIVVAVCACHAQNILHRDIKPHNIFLTKDLEVKLGDFGLAAILEDGVVIDDFAGTSEYAAPEVHNRKPQGTPADCWGIGAVLYELCTLNYYINASRKGDAIKKVVNAGGGPKITGAYSWQLRSVVESLLNTDPSKRSTLARLLKVPQIALVLEQTKTEDASKALASCQKELEAARQEIAASQLALKNERDTVQALRTELAKAKQHADALDALLDDRDRCIEQAAAVKRAEQKRKIQNEVKLTEKKHQETLFLAQVGSPTRKVREARQALGTVSERKITPLPRRAHVARAPAIVPNTVNQGAGLAAPLRSCLKKPSAAPPVPAVATLQATPDDVFLDIRSPRKGRDLRPVRNIPHMYAPTIPAPLVVPTVIVLGTCPATPQPKPRSDGELQATVPTPCAKTVVPATFGQPRVDGKYTPAGESKIGLGQKLSKMPVQCGLTQDAAWLAASPGKQFTRRPAFLDAGRTVNRMIAV